MHLVWQNKTTMYSDDPSMCCVCVCVFVTGAFEVCTPWHYCSGRHHHLSTTITLNLAVSHWSILEHPNQNKSFTRVCLLFQQISKPEIMLFWMLILSKQKSWVFQKKSSHFKSLSKRDPSKIDTKKMFYIFSNLKGSNYEKSTFFCFRIFL